MRHFYRVNFLAIGCTGNHESPLDIDRLNLVWGFNVEKRSDMVLLGLAIVNPAVVVFWIDLDVQSQSVFELDGRKSRKKYLEIGKYMGNPLKYIELCIKPIKIYRKWLGMVGNYPTYVLRSGGIPGRGLFCSSKVGPFLEKVPFCMFL